MTSLLLAALAALGLQDPAPAAPVALTVEIPELAGTTADPTCGGNEAMARLAFCVVTTQAAMQGLADQYNAAFTGQGWLAAGGENNLTVYVKRREAGGCDAFQLLAFAGGEVAAPAAPGYFAFATIPGDVCAAAAAAGAPPAAQAQ